MSLFRQISRVYRSKPCMRSMSVNSSSLTDLAVDEDGIAVLTLQRPPVNSLNVELLQAIINAFDDAAAKGCKGMILTSSLPTVFSAGLDINELYKPEMKRLTLFWKTFHDMALKFLTSDFPTATAINGHTPAGGYAVAMLSEYRVTTKGQFTIGFNDTALGIVPSAWITDLMLHTLSPRRGELALMASTMFSPSDALKEGLVDDIAEDKAGAIEKCKGFINQFNNIPKWTHSPCLQKIRRIPLESLYKYLNENPNEVLDQVTKKETQNALGEYVEKLKRRKLERTKK
ncbi:enoyl-CoA delta isomerase 1, mitochondrial-like [Galleria mellonella]|uniref:Enoyl-CoA delta isomerase 1, mitochondrial-like n=1 Tax=Galleria mellonella TaxID=7137 RepID=A0A6J3CC94_GALME|nr:enoyl-CoA delta isomerase 1, mitochondrial-like [Galleria mellonella]XP_026762669.2 enoyl-CoA delta isomerase 1, mitochondrial-like [Galleria mellonella]XP_031768714.2 enoyl-CoA delta isomerase 1, mitochondrial-like [Galleria mellonella]